jgi:pimeloyl-ACP methyl ester carboxylesterase
MVAARIRALLTIDARALLTRCPAPVLCLAGTDDGIVPPHNVQEIVSVRPSAAVRVIDGQHFAIYTNPSGAAKAIAEFIARADRA